MNIIILNRKKGLFIMSASFGVSAIIALAMPTVFGASYFSFFGAAIMFFAIPFVVFFFTRKKCFYQAFLYYRDSGMEIHELGEINNRIELNWKDIKTYQITPFNALAGNGFMLKFKFKSGKTLNKSIVEKNLIGSGGFNKNNSPLFAICSQINVYNQSQQLQGDKILLIPSFFASTRGQYILFIPLFLLVIDLIFLAGNASLAKRDISFFFSSLFFVIFFYAQRKSDRHFFELLLGINS